MTCPTCHSPLLRRKDGIYWCASCALSDLYDRRGLSIPSVTVEPPADLVDRVMARIYQTAEAQHDRILLTRLGVEEP